MNWIKNKKYRKNLKKHLHFILHCDIIINACCSILWYHKISAYCIQTKKRLWPVKRGENDEGRNPSQLQADYDQMCLRRGNRNRFDQEWHPCWNLLQVPSVFHGQAETRGYRRTCRSFQEEVRSHGQISNACLNCRIVKCGTNLPTRAGFLFSVCNVRERSAFVMAQT